MLSKTLTGPFKKFVLTALQGDLSEFKQQYGHVVDIRQSYLKGVVDTDGDTILPFLINKWHHNGMKLTVGDTLTDAGKIVGMILKAYKKYGIDPLSIRRSSGHEYPGMNTLHLAAIVMSNSEFQAFFELCLQLRIITGDNAKKIIGHSVELRNEMHRLHNIFYMKNGWVHGSDTPNAQLANKFLKMYNHNLSPNKYKEARKAVSKTKHFSSIDDLEAMFKRSHISSNNRFLPHMTSFSLNHHINAPPLREQHTPSRNLGTLPQAAHKRSRANNNTATSSGASGSTQVRGPTTMRGME